MRVPTFQFRSDSTCFAPISQPDDCKRTVTLTPGNNSIIFALGAGGLVPPFPLAPATFYDAQIAPDINTAGPLAFNQANFIAAIQAAGGNVNLLSPGTLLRFYSPIGQRPSPGLGVPVDLTNPPRFVSLLTQVNNSGIPTPQKFPFLVSEADFETAPNQPHPLMGIDLLAGFGGFTPMDTFWRLLPPVGGTAAFGMVMPLRVIRYSILPKTYGTKSSGVLVRETWGQTWEQPREIAQMVKELKFTRSSVSTPSVLPEIKIGEL